jgi:Amt family ammonium transporter
MVGTGMLWVGWYGFNAGSALAADGVSTNALIDHHAGHGDRRIRVGAGRVDSQRQAVHPRLLLGHCGRTGRDHAGVRVRHAKGAMIIGVLAAVIPYIAVVFVKGIFGYDDALDTFGVHGVGGTLGAIMTGVLADERNLNTNLKDELLSEPARSSNSRRWLSPSCSASSPRRSLPSSSSSLSGCDRRRKWKHRPRR